MKIDQEDSNASLEYQMNRNFERLEAYLDRVSKLPLSTKLDMVIKVLRMATWEGPVAQLNFHLAVSKARRILQSDGTIMQACYHCLVDTDRNEYAQDLIREYYVMDAETEAVLDRVQSGMSTADDASFLRVKLMAAKYA